VVSPPTVWATSTAAPRVSCYLVEWYHPEVTADTLGATAATLDESATSVSTEGSPVRLLILVSVPTDGVLFGVFTARSEQVVAQACQRAGIPAQRLTAAVNTRVRSGKGRHAAVTSAEITS
jgi:hypothetical protein